MHRIGSFNERSGRYSEFDDGEYYVPDVMRIQDTTNRQGSIFDTEGNLNFFRSAIDRFSIDAYFEYQRMIDAGVAKELARMILPVNFYSEMIWTVNLRSLFNFLKLRTDSHAQWEIQQYANVILEIIKEKLPLNYEMFLTYMKNNT